MKRRDFLKVLGTAAGGMLLGARGRAALAEGAAATAAAPGTAALGASPGAEAGVIRIGMSAAFQGTNAGLGTEYWRGSQAWYQEVNSQGGIAGRRIEVVALDDGYDPIPTIRNTIQLVEKDRVFCLSNYVGTPTLTRALPVIKRYAGDDLVLVGDLTGAQPQREPPYAAQVFNIRASYRQEMMALVERLWTAGVRRFGVFYQIDAYGRSGTDGVARGLARHGARIAAEATYRRGAAFDADMSVAARHLRDAGVEAVLCTGAYQACGAFVRTARDLGWTVPISNVSFVGSESMSRLLLEHGRTTGRDYTARLINTQVVPSYAADSPLPGVRLYRSLMDKRHLEVPAPLRDPKSKYRVEPYSFISFEGFINARVIVEGLRRAGPAPSRRGFKAALESIGQLDLGIGAPLAFGPDRHQGLDEVYFTRLAGDAWVPVDDWSAVIHV